MYEDDDDFLDEMLALLFPEAIDKRRRKDG